MEEDLKVLEEMKNRKIYFHSSYFISGYVELGKDEKQAIENIIKGYKELKEKYSKKLIELQKEREKSEHLLDEGIVTYFDDDELKESVGNYLGVLLKKNIEKDYISKDKIKAKIEYLDEEGYWEFTTDRDSDTAKEILQEFLQEGDK